MLSVKQRRILVVDDERDMRWILSTILKKNGYQVVTAKNGKEALHVINDFSPDILLLDLRMPEMSGVEVLKKVRDMIPEIVVIIITAYGEIQIAVQAMKMGAHDFIMKPFDNENLLLIIKRACEKLDLEDEVHQLRQMIKKHVDLHLKMGRSVHVEHLVGKVNKVAQTDFSVLIWGETGTGKELIAGAIHMNSQRSKRPFVTVDCGAIPETLIESELFGYERGAFTGAYNAKRGLFEAAHTGTLFLDEISNLSKTMQMKLLRVLQNREITLVGGIGTIPVDVRIICASNVDLLSEVKKDKFRMDIYYRITEFVIEVPPLRERKDDILYLVNLFLEEVNKDLGKKVEGLSDEAKKILLLYDWPGNVRELRNLVRRSALIANKIIGKEHLPYYLTDLRREQISLNEMDSLIRNGISWKELKKHHVKRMEREVFTKLLNQTKGNKRRAAKLLKMDYKTFHTKVKELGIQIDNHFTMEQLV